MHGWNTEIPLYTPSVDSRKEYLVNSVQTRRISETIDQSLKFINLLPRTEIRKPGLLAQKNLRGLATLKMAFIWKLPRLVLSQD